LVKILFDEFYKIVIFENLRFRCAFSLYLGEPLGEELGEPLGEPLGDPLGESFLGSFVSIFIASDFLLSSSYTSSILSSFISSILFKSIGSGLIESTFSNPIFFNGLTSPGLSINTKS